MKNWRNILRKSETTNLKKLIPIETYTADTQPYRIFYRVAGPLAGPKVLLVHGLALSSAYLQPLMRQMAAQGYRVYAPDLPGTGRSERAPGTLTVAQHAENLIEWVKKVGLNNNEEKFHLVGHSAGGQTSIDLALQHPEWVETLSLVSITGGKSVRGWIPLVLSIGLDAFFELNPLVFIALYRYFHTGVIETLQTTYFHCKDEVRPKVAGLGSFPTLILWAGRDVVTPLWFGRTLEKLISNSRLIVIPRATHGLAYSQYQAVAENLHQFLSGENLPVPLPVGISVENMDEAVVA